MNRHSAKYCFLAMLLGFGAVVYFLHHDYLFKQYVERQIKQLFLHSFKSILEGNVKDIDIVRGEITLEHVMVNSPEDSMLWYWKAENFVLQFSWLSFFLKKKFDVAVSLYNLTSQSQLQGSEPAIIEHLKNFIAGAAGFPATLKMLTIKKGRFELNDYEKELKYTTDFNGTYGNNNGLLQFHINVNEGQLCFKNSTIATQCSAAIHSSIKETTIQASISGKTSIEYLPTGKKICAIDGQWLGQVGQLFLTSPDNDYKVTVYNVMQTKTGLAGDVASKMPLSYLYKVFPFLQRFHLEGMSECSAHIDLGEDYSIQSNCLLRSLNLGGYAVGDVALTLGYNHELLQSTYTFLGPDSLLDGIDGDFSYNQKTKKAILYTHNKKTISINQECVINPQDLCIDLSLTDKIVTGSYQCAVHYAKNKNPFVCKGVVAGDVQSLKTSGIIATKKYDIELSLQPEFAVKKSIFYEQPEKPLVQLQSSNSGIKASINFDSIQEIIHSILNYKLMGEGTALLDVGCSNMVITSTIAMHDSNIRIPSTYTIIRGLKGTVAIDLLNRMVIFSEVAVELDKGTLACQRAVIRFNEQGVCDYLFIPCTIQKAFLTLQKNLFIVLSGTLLVTYDQDKGPAINGRVIIDRGHCKKNIFSKLDTPVENNFLSSFENDLIKNCTLNLAFETKNPLDVKTSFLETNVQAAIQINGTVQNPELSGSINLENGMLAFPYKPLAITHGSIYFLPHQLHDPTIELIAKGKIRKYHVTLRCNGSLQHPNISFESTPPLTEEQIITLLLAGSEEGSLSLAMPALIMQKIQNVIFGPEQSASKLEGYFKSLLEPLKHIRFIPAFSDQAGRGGFRGSIEIDVNDQLRAMIQKNFSLSEDIKLEVEYFLSDDVTVRGMRDERGDYGGEVEMRWKF